MENDRGTEETWSDWDGSNRNVAAGTILASALVAGLIAYFIRRRRREDEYSLGGLSDRAISAVGDDRVSAGREFLTERILPEFKPALLAILVELEEVVDQAFRRAERAVKDL